MTIFFVVKTTLSFSSVVHPSSKERERVGRAWWRGIRRKWEEGDQGERLCSEYIVSGCKEGFLPRPPVDLRSSVTGNRPRSKLALRQKFDLEEIARRLMEMRTYRKCNSRETWIWEREKGRGSCVRSRRGKVAFSNKSGRRPNESS